MRKLCILFIFYSITFLMTTSLHLTEHKNNHKYSIYRPNHRVPYYGRYQRNHKEQGYVKKVIDSNLQFITQFNKANQQLLKQVKDQNGLQNQVSGGHPYMLGLNHFIEFTDEQLSKTFLGSMPSVPQQQDGTSENAEEKEADHFENQMRARFLRFNNAEIHRSQKTQSYFKQNNLNQRLVLDSQDQKKNAQTLINHNIHFVKDRIFQNPYKINDNDLENLYGNVNSDDNFGWDWKEMDPNYYSEFEDDDPQHYWADWQLEHWGHDNNGHINAKWYWDDWNKTEKQNQNNEDWWNDDWWNDDWWEGDQKDDDKVNEDWWNEDWWNGDWWEDNQKGDDSIKKKDIQKNKTLPKQPGNNGKPFDPFPSTAVQVNWVTIGATSHIKHQGQCGSCWAHATIGLLQSSYLIMGMGLMDLSEQNLVDCNTKAHGCNGGHSSTSLQYIKNNGILSQEKYPYIGKVQQCAHSSGPHKIIQYGYVGYWTNFTGLGLQQQLRKGTASSTVAVNKPFFYYLRGIFSSCSAGGQDHEVVVVGFTKDYWIIRNSWGTTWGEQGHMRILKDQWDRGNACNITTYITYIVK